MEWVAAVKITFTAVGSKILISVYYFKREKFANFHSYWKSISIYANSTYNKFSIL